MNAATPLVSIGLPVYNGEKHLRRTIETLIGQTYRNIELIISDNASTDSTPQLCAELAQQDARIRFTRNDRNIGAAQNFGKVQQDARGVYFMWAGAHDLWHAELIEGAVKALEAHPNAVIAGAECKWIDAEGEPYPRESGWTDTRGLSVVERFFTVLFGNMHPVLGVIRREALLRTRGIHASMGSDLVLLAELSLLGDFIHIPGTHWCRRELRGAESYSAMLKRYRSVDYGITRGFFDRFFPTLTLACRLLRVAWSMPIGAPSRIVVCSSLLALFPARYIAA